MTAGEAIKKLKAEGFELLNHKGSHMKFGKELHRITIVYHSKDSERLCRKAIKNVNLIIEKSKI